MKEKCGYSQSSDLYKIVHKYTGTLILPALIVASQPLVPDYLSNWIMLVSSIVMFLYVFIQICRKKVFSFIIPVNALVLLGIWCLNNYLPEIYRHVSLSIVMWGGMLLLLSVIHIDLRKITGFLYRRCKRIDVKYIYCQYVWIKNCLKITLIILLTFGVLSYKFYWVWVDPILAILAIVNLWLMEYPPAYLVQKEARSKALFTNIHYCIILKQKGYFLLKRGESFTPNSNNTLYETPFYCSDKELNSNTSTNKNIELFQALKNGQFGNLKLNDKPIKIESTIGLFVWISKELCFVNYYIVETDDEIIPEKTTSGIKWWSIQHLEENLSKDVFSPVFETVYPEIQQGRTKYA